MNGLIDLAGKNAGVYFMAIDAAKFRESAGDKAQETDGESTSG